MAGGIDWFRWHHGSVNDPKFRLVASRSRSSVAEVIAVWATLLEAASMADKRGQAGVPDFEALDCALGLREGQSKDIFSAMTARDLVSEDGSVTAWDRRQPKREREEDNSTERVRAFRERQRQSETGNATKRTETPRGEESREEEDYGPKGPASSAPTRAAEVCLALKAEGIGNVNPGNIRLRTLLDAGATVEEFTGMAGKALGQVNPFAYVLAAVEGERKRAVATAGTLHRGPIPVAETPRVRAARLRTLENSGGILGREKEIVDGTVRALG